MAEIALRDVWLRYPVYEAHRSFRVDLLSRRVGGIIGRAAPGSIPFVTALRGIDLALADGMRLGLVGHNGSGKSTLIKVLGGIYEPSQGEVLVSGRTATLITMGLGMDPDDTGYENIVNCGLYLGMSPAEIAERMPEIAEFTELGDFLSLPLKTFSSGMVVRLAFAITTAIAPEIIIMDEGIGAGDARFAKKAKLRLERMIDACSIMVLASHSRELIAEFCSEAALLDQGRIVRRGPVADVLAHYGELSRA
ncbi:MAG TPA: ABC transporter ATP-binding protein [Hyphomicrobiaceae bacterium]|nr:ABC transporter ATP-binding protein [Hyphomicrobiaceae bacterium]